MGTLIEHERCRPGANGIPVRLADGQFWLLARPSYRPDHQRLTRPLIDLPLDRLFDSITIEGKCGLEDIWEVARALLYSNYHLTDDEFRDLLSVSSETECNTIVSGVLEALFGPAERARTYTDWVRSSLIANGLRISAISAHDLSNVLAILVATNRTVPLSRFADTCAAMAERRTLDTLV